jgi:hypothetical protein
VIGLLRLLFDLVLAFVAPRAALVAENLILRQQLIVVRRQIKRPSLHRFDRWIIGALAGRFHRLLDAVLLVKPETVIGWHRTAWRLRWRSRRPPGRPPVDADLRELIRRMWRENPTWGQRIIAAELAKLGYQISPRTVAKYRPSATALRQLHAHHCRRKSVPLERQMEYLLPTEGGEAEILGERGFLDAARLWGAITPSELKRHALPPTERRAERRRNRSDDEGRRGSGCQRFGFRLEASAGARVGSHPAVASEALGVGLDEDEGIAPTGPGARQRHPEEAVGPAERRARARATALENDQLLAQRQVLQGQRGAAAEGRPGGLDEVEEEREHGQIVYPVTAMGKCSEGPKITPGSSFGEPQDT